MCQALSNGQATSNKTKSLAFLEFICWHGKTNKRKARSIMRNIYRMLKNKAIEKTVMQGKRN